MTFTTNQNFPQSTPTIDERPSFQQKERTYKFKIILLGDGGTGKTTYITRVAEGHFIQEYIATVGATCYPIQFNISQTETIRFEVWDTAGQEKNFGLGDTYYYGADGAIILFDVTQGKTFSHVRTWLHKIHMVQEDNKSIPIVVCGNKVDLDKRKVKSKAIKKSLSTSVTHYTDMSAKANYKFELPFLVLARELTNRPDLKFVSRLKLKPAETSVKLENVEMSDAIMKDLEAAKNLEISDDEIDF